MYDLLILTILFSIAIFLFAIVIGSNLFAIMVDEQVRYLQLIALYGPMKGPPIRQSRPEPVSEYLAWAFGDKSNPPGCARLQFRGRMKIGKNGRWLKMSGRAWFNVAVPYYVWHATVTFAPGIWIETCDYYVHRNAGMIFNLFSFFPLNNNPRNDILASSLFRYLASTPLFPHVLASKGSVSWETIDNSSAIAIIHDGSSSVRALVRFNGNYRIESITLHDTKFPARKKPLPGLFTSSFSGYTEIRGFQVPQHIVFEAHLPDGGYSCTEYTVTGIEYTLSRPDSEVISR